MADSLARATAPAGFVPPDLPRLLPCAYRPRAAQIEIASNGWGQRMLGGCLGDDSVWDGTTSGLLSLTDPIAQFLPAWPAGTSRRGVTR